MIPPEIYRLSHLKMLSLNSNKLSGECSHVGFCSMGGPARDEVFTLSIFRYDHCWKRITLIGIAFYRTKAPPWNRVLSRVYEDILGDCYHFGAGVVPTEICSLTQMEKLRLNSNELSGEHMHVRCGSLPGNPRNKAVTLYIYFEARPVLEKFICDEMECCHSEALSGTIALRCVLRYLLPDLYSHANTGAIPATIGTLSRLEELNLAKNKHTGECSQLGFEKQAAQLPSKTWRGISHHARPVLERLCRPNRCLSLSGAL